MKPYTYDESKKPFYEKCYDLLVKHAGARSDPRERECFVWTFTQVEYPGTEYRFQGHLGFGGKFYRSGGHHHIACYREDETPEIRKTIDIVNEKLRELGPP